MGVFILLIILFIMGIIYGIKNKSKVIIIIATFLLFMLIGLGIYICLNPY